MQLSTMNDIANTLNVIQAVTAVFGAAIVFIAFLIPLTQTFIPLWKKKGRRPHFEMWNRLVLRLMIVALLLHDAIFPLDRIWGTNLNLICVRATVIPIIIIIVFMLIHSWLSHPDGMRGL